MQVKGQTAAMASLEKAGPGSGQHRHLPAGVETDRSIYGSQKVSCSVDGPTLVRRMQPHAKASSCLPTVYLLTYLHLNS